MISISRCVNRAKQYINSQYYHSRDYEMLGKINLTETDFMFQHYKQYTDKYQSVDYTVSFLPLNKQVSSKRCKWVGAVLYNDIVYVIPNGESRFIQISDNVPLEYFGELGHDNFKWTGGCQWKDFVYGFPRTRNSFIRVSIENNKTEEIPLQFIYNSEHHYGGICTKEGMVYQPPRNTDHILVTDLNTMESYKICLAPSWLRLKLRYCGSIIHPNGCIYFFPERNGRVIKLDMRTNKWMYIGENISTMTFDAVVATDGNIYGFSAYEPGIMKIDTAQNSCRMLHRSIFYGAYGTKLGVNGRIYSIPGNGDFVWEYNPVTDVSTKLYHIDNKVKPKFAGGVIKQDGTIIGVPAKEDRLLILTPTQKNIHIPYEIYETNFKDFY